ncbi:MAG: hypothetical protein QXH10_02135 [Ignisphaera sp.]
MGKIFYRILMISPIVLLLILSTLQTLYAPNRIVSGQGGLEGRVMEKLGRGLVALRISNNSVWLSWKLLATDPNNTMFNIYRRIGYGPLVKVNNEPLYLTWFIDNLTDFDFSEPVTYYVVSVIDGVEVEVSKPYTLNPGTPIGNYISIPLRQDALNFAGAVQGARLAGIGDLDGDGEYEIVVKRGDQDLDPSQASIPTHLPQETYKLEAYKLDGTFLWRVDLGRNIRPGIYYSPFVVYDLDGDGRAEVAAMIGENATFYTRDGKVIVIGDVNNDGTTVYADELGRQVKDPLYFVIIDGAAGYPLAFGEWLYMYNWTYWGDNYGNRACRNMIAVAYLDGELPSLIIARGIYTHIYVEAWNWRNGKLTKLWTFYLPNPGVSKGFQQMRTGDIDGDGKDEIVYGTIAIDDNGQLLWDSGLLHGDRFHIADIDPSRPGLEIFYVQERPGSCTAGCRYVFVENGKNCTVVNNTVVCKPVSGEVTLYQRPGVALVEAATGKLIWAYIGSGISDQDIGRGSCGDVDPRYPGMECWATRPTTPGNLFNSSGYIVGPRMNLTNFNIWWDGDLLREHLDVVFTNTFSVSKYDWERRIWRHIFNVTNIIPGSRNAPLAYGDIIGDWREEFVVITADKKEMRVYVSTEPTNYTIYTLMHDPQYRLNVAMQTHGYMQSNQLSFYLGTETTFPIPKPNIRYPEPKTVTYTIPAFPVMPWTPTVTYTITTTTVQTTTTTVINTVTVTKTIVFRGILLFVKGLEGSVYYGIMRNGNIIWIPLSGYAEEAPSATQYGDGVFVFVRGGDDGVWYGFVDLSSFVFSGWVRLPGSTSSRPSVASTPYGVVVVVRGIDNGIYLGLVNGNNFSGWYVIPGKTIDAPAITFDGNLLHLIVRGEDGNLYHTTIDPTTYTQITEWTIVPGATDVGPDLASGNGFIILAVKGLENGVWIKVYNVSTGTWNEWQRIPGGSTDATPTVVLTLEGITIFVKGLDETRLWMSKIVEGQWIWQSLPGSSAYQPEAIFVEYVV